MTPRTALRSTLTTALLLALAAPLLAQRRPPGPSLTGARVLEIGARGGVDLDQQAFVAGAFLRMPVDPWRRFALMPGAQVEFLNNATEWQLDADAVVLLGARRTIFLGGGAAFRSARYPDDPEQRDMRTGYNLIAGVRTPPVAGEVGTQLEFRWVEVDAYNPQVLTLGVVWGMPIGF